MDACRPPFPQDQHGARFHGHVIAPGVAVVDMISVPPSQRRSGIGGEMYRTWEASLPEQVTSVHLWATVSAVPFWKSMGFSEDRRTTTNPVGMNKTLYRARATSTQ